MSYDSDIAEAFRELKKSRTLKKVANLEFSTKLLIDKDIEFEAKNGGTHLMIKHGGVIVADFWPSTGKYKFRDSNRYKRGVKNLIKDISKHSQLHDK